MAIKFDNNKRGFQKNNGMSVHISGVHNDYNSAWKYATKDKHALESDNHLELTNTTKSPKIT